MKHVREWTAELDGLRIHIRDVGDGPPVLLINGLGANTSLWSTAERALDGFRLIEFDAPGTGGSGTPLRPVSVPRLARLATHVLDEVGVDRVDVLGYSMGGLIAQQLAADAPGRVRRVVLVATSVGLGGVTGDALAMLNIAAPLRYLSPRLYAWTIGGLAGGRARHDREWVAAFSEQRMRQAPTLHGYTSQLLGLTGWSGLPLLERIGQPTLVVTGDDDPLAPVANAMILARWLPRARLLVARDEGHLLLVDPASVVLEPIRQFLGAGRLDEAPVWRNAAPVVDQDVTAAIRAARRQAQPWGSLGAIMRRRWLIPRDHQPEALLDETVPPGDGLDQTSVQRGEVDRVGAARDSAVRE